MGATGVSFTSSNQTVPWAEFATIANCRFEIPTIPLGVFGDWLTYIGADTSTMSRAFVAFYNPLTQFAIKKPGMVVCGSQIPILGWFAGRPIRLDKEANRGSERKLSKMGSTPM
jgi:hypothetical protein